MKICFVTDSYPPNIGGAEVVIQNIVEGVAKHGIETIIITTCPESISSAVVLDETNIVRIKIPNFLRRFWFIFFSIQPILKHAKSADLIHGTSYGGIIPSYIAGLILHKPMILTVHEFMGKNWFRYTNNFFAAFYYFLAEKIFAKLSFARFIAVSSYTKSKLIEAGIPEVKIALIFNGESYIGKGINKSVNNIKTELGIKEDEIVFAAFGRTGLTKGFEYLVDAIPFVLSEIKSSKFLLILTKGDNKIWKSIYAKIQKLDKNRIIFYSSLEKEKLFDYLNASDVIIIPSLSEGFGYTTLEAVMLNKKIIATNVGAIPEVIGGNYILIEPKSAKAITSACIKAFNKEFHYKEARKFNWENSIKSYMDLYKEIINLNHKL